MDSKYYTPSIEEFHIGFEYEYRNGDKWEKDILSKFSEEMTPDTFVAGFIIASMFCNIDGTLTEEGKSSIRVKYLDKEDIESLGWEYVEDRGMSENYGYTFNKPIQYLSGGDAWYKLRYWFTNHRVRIEPLGGPIFDGTIKNKSELKILLKQLGI